MEINGFECCFCKKDILENKIDPCDINIVINSDGFILTNIVF